jgi:hypothetical protein
VKQEVEEYRGAKKRGSMRRGLRRGRARGGSRSEGDSG